MPENWTDLFTVEQSKLYSAVLATKYANYVPVLMAYMSIIIKCHKRFDGLGWYNYDRAFRRQAATLKHLNWSIGEDCSEDLTLSVTPHTVVFKCMGTTKDPQRQAALCTARDRISNGRRRQSKLC